MAIDYLEFGVHQGHSIFHFAGENKSSNSRFFGFDTFTGLPEDWNKDFRRGHFDMAGKPPRTGDARVEFVVGSFQETLPKFVTNFKTDNPIIVHLDCDLYSSALYCLTKLDTALPPGTILIFDEFGDVQHEFRAVHVTFPVIAVRSACCVRTTTFLRLRSSSNKSESAGGLYAGSSNASAAAGAQ
jgi:hypothetical protein